MNKNDLQSEDAEDRQKRKNIIKRKRMNEYLGGGILYVGYI